MKKLISLLLCLSLILSLCAVPAFASEDLSDGAEAPEETVESEAAAETLPEEAPPALDGGELATNVFYYNVYPDSTEAPLLMAEESIEPGAHPSKIPTWGGMVFTWHLTADLSGDPVDPASYTIESESGKLTFYGYLDTVCVRLHLPAGSDVDIFDEKRLNPGSTYDASKQEALPIGYWAAGWADADGNLFDTENTPIWEDTDLYALAGNFRVTYMVGEEQIGGEGFFDPGTPKHAPTSYLQMNIGSNGGIDQKRYAIAGWTNEDGEAVDISTVTVAADRTFYAVLDHSQEIGETETDWGFDWTLDTFTHTLTLGGAEILTPAESVSGPDFRWTTPWANDAASIENVVVEEGVEEIDAGFFYGLSGLKTVELPFSIQRVAHDIFLTSEQLDSITVADGQGYECIGWLDEEGYVFESESILTGEEYSGDLYSAWLYAWNEGRFTDVGRTVWYHDAVKFCYQTGLMNGVSESLFSPGGTATRGQVVTVLWRLAGEPFVEDESWYGAFSDVPLGVWYSNAVAWAAAYGITTGYTDGTFRPGNPVTRQEFLTFLYRYTESWLGEQPPACDRDTLREFVDYADVASWSEQAECWSVNAGLQTGSQNKDGTYSLNPRQSIKRSELATFLTRYCGTLSIIHLV